jgi:hypothetical protein
MGQSMQHATTVSATQMCYSRIKLLEEREKLLSLWVDDLNQKNILLTQAVIADKVSF